MAFVLSKILWMFVGPGNLIVLLLLTGAFLALSRHDIWQKVGSRMCFYIAFLLFFIAIFPVGEWTLAPLENNFPMANPEHVDGIIVIGSDENAVLTDARDQPSVHIAADNYLVFASLVRKYPDAKLAFAGGSSSLLPAGTRITDAQVAKQALAAYGVPVERMLFEDKSRNTYENAVDGAALVHPNPREKWLLVTEAFHMPRSIACFRKAGWNVIPAPSNFYTNGKLSSELNLDFTGHLGQITAAAHEYYGLFSYWLLGYIDTPWPKP